MRTPVCPSHTSELNQLAGRTILERIRKPGEESSKIKFSNFPQNV